MRRTSVILATAAALAACHPVEHKNPAAQLFSHGPLTAPGRLTCPDSVDELTRTAQAADGQSCDYTGPQDEQVTLSLLALNGRAPAAALADVETDLKTSTGLRAAPGANGVKIDATDNDTGADENSSGDDDDHDRPDHDHSDHDRHDHANIDLPGLHIHADNGKADIQLPGFAVHADGDKAQVSTGFGASQTTVVNAGDGGAEIRAGDVTANGADLVYVLSGQPGAQGYRATGYIARGPRAGPLVVGQFKAKHDGNHDWKGNGLDRLVKMNVSG